MNILDIAIAKKLAGGGGGSGTDNYNDLSNLPKINDTTLSGNKSSSALGLQSEINSDSKLASDLVDDTNQDNKFVTSTEKNTWSAKQNAIDSDHKLSSDLVDDANKTNKFVTSTEKNTWNAKQNAIDSEHKLSSSLVSFTDAEAAALASGIDSSKVGQISTNQTNILYSLNTGVKNLIVMSELSANYHGITVNRTPKGVTISGTADADISLGLTGTILDTSGQDPKLYSMFSKLPNSVKLTGAPDSQQKNRIIIALYNDSTWVYSFSSLYDMPQDLSSYTYNRWYAYIPIVRGTSYSGTWYPMLQDASINDDTFVPGALPNSDLTYLEAEDRAALAEEIDAGAKQLAQGQNNSGSAGTATIQSDGYTVKLTGSAASSSSLSFATTGTIQKTGTYVFAIEASGTMDRISIWDNTASASVETLYATGSKEVTLTAGHSYALFHFAGSAMTLNATVKYMICTKAAFGVSSKFVPYRVPINGVFWAEKYEARSTTLVSTGIKFTASKQTIYRITATAQYGNSKPTQLVIKKKLIPSESEGNFVAVSSDANSQSLTATGIMALGVGGYFEVYAAYDGTTSNRVYAIVEEVVL